MKAALHLDIVLPDDKVFTNHSIVQGNVVFQVEEDIPVSNIYVKLQGLSKTRILPSQPILHHGDKYHVDKDKAVTNEHELLSMVVPVFPPATERQVMTSTEYTLTKGTYIYPFAFKIPLKNKCKTEFGPTMRHKAVPKSYTKVRDQGGLGFKIPVAKSSIILKSPASSHQCLPLPPTFSLGNVAKVKYKVKAFVCRGITSQMQTWDFVAKKTFNFMPLRLENQREGGKIEYRQVREYFDLNPNESNSNSPYYFAFKILSPYIIPGMPLESTLSFCCKSRADFQRRPPVYVSRIRVALLCISDLSSVQLGIGINKLHKIKAVDKHVLVDKNTNMYPLTTSKESANAKLDLTELTIPPEFIDCIVPDSIVPTFETCNLKQTYKIEVSIIYALKPKSRSSFLGLFTNSSSPQEIKLVTDEMPILSNKWARQTSHVVRQESQETLPLYQEIAPT